jgi:hypothetical protein
VSCLCDMNGRGKASHCRSCCLTFSGPWAFDRHIVRGQHEAPDRRGLVEVRTDVWGKPADLSARNFLLMVRSDDERR